MIFGLNGRPDIRLQQGFQANNGSNLQASSRPRQPGKEAVCNSWRQFQVFLNNQSAKSSCVFTKFHDKPDVVLKKLPAKNELTSFFADQIPEIRKTLRETTEYQRPERKSSVLGLSITRVIWHRKNCRFRSTRIRIFSDSC